MGSSAGDDERQRLVLARGFVGCAPRIQTGRHVAEHRGMHPPIRGAFSYMPVWWIGHSCPTCRSAATFVGPDKSQPSCSRWYREAYSPACASLTPHTSCAGPFPASAQQQAPGRLTPGGFAVLRNDCVQCVTCNTSDTCRSRCRRCSTRRHNSRGNMPDTCRSRPRRRSSRPTAPGLHSKMSRPSQGRRKARYS